MLVSTGANLFRWISTLVPFRFTRLRLQVRRYSPLSEPLPSLADFKFIRWMDMLRHRALLAVLVGSWAPLASIGRSRAPSVPMFTSRPCREAFWQVPVCKTKIFDIQDGKACALIR
ncbi:hypothetical protein SCHPADRAFT_232138 [Schizopora paradoxa]|uniref:Uncharacterized protein n=1 Tax=Schizopora paradoxa TaxID=27342 RepID=A0A0H2RWN1_9AGAM|nr:hypothetical protein SCHPADRAFT_232138 [Schizopora paradoxa]